MACGIIAGDGADPLERWRSRLTWLGSEDLTGNVRALLRGEQWRHELNHDEIRWQLFNASVASVTSRPNS